MENKEKQERKPFEGCYSDWPEPEKMAYLNSLDPGFTKAILAKLDELNAFKQKEARTEIMKEFHLEPKLESLLEGSEEEMRALGAKLATASAKTYPAFSDAEVLRDPGGKFPGFETHSPRSLRGSGAFDPKDINYPIDPGIGVTNWGEFNYLNRE